MANNEDEVTLDLEIMHTKVKYTNYDLHDSFRSIASAPDDHAYHRVDDCGSCQVS